MDTAVTRVERSESRKTAITSTANARPSRPSWKRVSMDCWMKGAWSNTTVRSAPPPTTDSSSGSASRTASETATRSASGVAVTETERVSAPSVRVTDVGSAAWRETSATSPRVRGSPSPAGSTGAVGVTSASAGGPPPPPTGPPSAVRSCGAAPWPPSAGVTTMPRMPSRSSTAAPAWTG